MSDRPGITIRKDFPRPSRELVARFAEMPTGWVVDAQGRRGAIDHRIRPLLPPGRFAGVALTVSTVSRDNLVPYAALPYVQFGDVLMIGNRDDLSASVIGDLYIGQARNCGAAAIVTDGLARDIEGIEAVGIPVYARGLSPNSPEKNGPGEIGLPVTIGGQVVAPGDIIVGDRDGVVVVPRTTAEDVLAGLDAVAEKERRMEAAVRDGLKYPDWLEQTLAAKGVRYVD